MFGALKPSLKHVSAECKKRYTSTYCNLCAALSATGAGVWNRLFLVNDVVTIDWLFSETGQEEHPFQCYNCVKGGVIGRKHRIPDHQRFMAAVSTYVCGVKINDNAIDDPKLKNKSLALVYRPMMKKAEKTLREFKVLDQLQTYQAMDRQNELTPVTEIGKAAEPTEKCYELLTNKGASHKSSLPQTLVTLMGRYLGRNVYILDAIKDMADDAAASQYNVLNLMSASSATIHQVISQCINYLKPLRNEITHHLSQLPNTLQHRLFRKKWHSVMVSVDRQLFKLIEPLNCKDLLADFASCATVENTCPQCASSWSSVMACLPACIACPCCAPLLELCSGCCPCCKCCEGCCPCCE